MRFYFAHTDYSARFDRIVQEEEDAHYAEWEALTRKSRGRGWGGGRRGWGGGGWGGYDSEGLESDEFDPPSPRIDMTEVSASAKPGALAAWVRRFPSAAVAARRRELPRSLVAAVAACEGLMREAHCDDIPRV
jgi:hypothetical protein